MTVAWQIAGLALFAAGLLSAAVWILLDDRMSPDKRERMRRLVLSRKGRLTEGTIAEGCADALYYLYNVNGVVYNTSQDITTLSDFLPADPECLVGVVSVKYATQNPANSIVISEKWSGLPQSKPKEQGI